MLKLIREMKPRDRLLWLLSSLVVLGQVWFDLKLPGYMSALTDAFQDESVGSGAMWATGGGMLLCMLGSVSMLLLSSLLCQYATSGFGASLRDSVFARVTGFGRQELDRFSIPSLINRTTRDITMIENLFRIMPQMLIKAPIMAVWTLIVILRQNAPLSAVVAGCLFVTVVPLLLMILRLLPRFTRLTELTDDMNRVVREDVTGIQVVHAFNAEAYQEKKFRALNRDVFHLERYTNHAFGLLLDGVAFMTNFMYLAIYLFGAQLANGMALTDPARAGMLDSVNVFAVYSGYLTVAFLQMIMVMINIPRATIAGRRVLEVLCTPTSVTEGTRSDAPEKGTLEFRDVSFRYPDGGADVLEHISFRVEPGQTLAVIGGTGSGKTTLVSLMTRLFDATEGDVLLDGVNVKDYTFDALYDRVGFAPQRAQLFSGTVESNLRLGHASGISDEEAWEALDLAQAKEFVSGREGGLESPIAQSGRNVSGGQKQRLSVARALAGHSEVMIFDDTFSALDFKTDRALRAALRERRRGTTLVIVAQRISTIRHADSILVLDKGRMAGLGTHRELMESCPVYREIAESQLSQSELAAEGGVRA